MERVKPRDRTEKTCPRCHITKPVGGFYPSTNRSDGRSSHCKVCARQKIQERYNRVRPVLPEGFKFCPRCKRVLAVDGFAPDAAARSGRQSYCRECWPAYMRYWRRTTNGGFVQNEKLKRARRTPEHKRKTRARLLTKLAIEFGYITATPCEVCGDPQSVTHHTQYEKPLDGIHFYCQTHHLSVGHGGYWNRDRPGTGRSTADEANRPP